VPPVIKPPSEDCMNLTPEELAQNLLENKDKWWWPLWQNMPEFVQKKGAEPWKQLLVNFYSRSDFEEFARLLGQNLLRNTRSIDYPEREVTQLVTKRYSAGKQAINPKYPVYVISKGRWESRLTVKSLEEINVPYRVVIEPQEYEAYAAVMDPAKLLILPFSNLGQGSIPARNWVWEHSISEGAEWHWIMDDNIERFYRTNRNMKVPVSDGTILRLAEDFAERFENVAQAGLNYFYMYARKEVFPPITLNTRIYSCILLRNDLPFRWRGKYNEDTDLSLRVLKAGFCTILYNTFKCGKKTTLTMKGGNTDELYADDGRLQMAKSLEEQHPDVTKVVWKWGRWQHSVNYAPFAGNQLKPKPGLSISEGVNDWGMVLQDLIDGRWVTRNQDASAVAVREAMEKLARAQGQSGAPAEVGDALDD
jgi:hypothetical protein